MKPSKFTLRAISLALVGSASASFGAATAQISPEQLQFFENKIRPIFANHCLECHSAEKGKVKGGLNMDSREDVLKGGESGIVLKPGSPRESGLIRAVEWVDDLQMPPKKKLSDEQIAALKEWIAMGAPDPREGTGIAKPSKKDHWAFQPVSRPTPPEVKNSTWIGNSIDKFVLAKLEEAQMFPAELPYTGSAAERTRKQEAVLRRAYFDLIGMPPSPREIEAFKLASGDKKETYQKAFEKVVDDLLASPAYGERWARHWMDTARYSDTTGVVGNQRGEDYRYAYAWSYRDWLISVINKDMPYDQFIMHQLAADKIPDNPKENLAALGFLTVGQRFQNKDDIINDRIDVVGRGFLGLTIACARCHDHKFDPIRQADYYALRGVFASSVEPREGPVIAGDPNSKEYVEFTQKLDALEKRGFAAYYQIQREETAKLRQHPAAYFQAAHYLKQRDNVEARKAADAIIEKHKLDDRFITDFLTRHHNAKDSVWGPFVKLYASNENRDKIVELMLSGKKTGDKHNPLVIDFLKGAGALPKDLETVAALFEKFCREKLDPEVGAKVNPKVDPVKDLESGGGIFKVIADPKTDVANSEKKPLMEAAVFPLRLVPGSEMSVFKLQDEAKSNGLRLGGLIESRTGLARINELKLTFRGGPVRAMVLEDLPKPIDSPIYPRGNAPKKDDNPTIVPRRFIEILAEGGNAQPFKEGSGRLELARAIASKKNPLTARVMVNRIWMYHFGEGLVRTPDDLGNQAGQASHPELLEFLSSWFMEDLGPTKPAWSVKALHKAIMTSSAYQQSSRTPYLERQQKMNASNSLLWRANVRRLDFESFRDSLLTMAGTMDKTLFGPPVNITSEPFSFRRSVYGYMDRTNVPDLLMQFDMASALEPNTKRTSTIVPQQALFLMNSPFTVGVVQKIVSRPEVVEGVVAKKDYRLGVQAIFRIVLQRTASPEEIAMAKDFLDQEARAQEKVKAATAEIAAAAMKRAEAAAKSAQNDGGARKAIANEGELVRRSALSPWETLVQALMFCNEAAYLN
ncbi:MAG: hypothetical protein RLZZ399_1693 [Verrucomicrobiota bacterium]|jgi:hypothetical protein